MFLSRYLTILYVENGFYLDGIFAFSVHAAG
jgi:hypothetical protein